MFCSSCLALCDRSGLALLVLLFAIDLVLLFWSCSSCLSLQVLVFWSCSSCFAFLVLLFLSCSSGLALLVLLSGLALFALLFWSCSSCLALLVLLFWSCSSCAALLVLLFMSFSSCLALLVLFFLLFLRTVRNCVIPASTTEKKDCHCCTVYLNKQPYNYERRFHLHFGIMMLQECNNSGIL